MSKSVEFWTPENVALLHRYADEGISHGEAARLLGRSRTAVVWQASRRGIKLASASRRLFTPEEDIKIRDLASEGRNWKEIGDIIGRPRKSVSGRARTLGISFSGKRGNPHASKLTPPPRTSRKCLICTDMFPSVWIGNRVCPKCSNSPAYQTSGSAMI